MGRARTGRDQRPQKESGIRQAKSSCVTTTVTTIVVTVVRCPGARIWTSSSRGYESAGAPMVTCSSLSAGITSEKGHGVVSGGGLAPGKGHVHVEGTQRGHDAFDHVDDRLLPLKQSVRHPLDPPSTLLVRRPAAPAMDRAPR